MQNDHHRISQEREHRPRGKPDEECFDGRADVQLPLFSSRFGCGGQDLWKGFSTGPGPRFRGLDHTILGRRDDAVRHEG